MSFFAALPYAFYFSILSLFIRCAIFPPADFTPCRVRMLYLPFRRHADFSLCHADASYVLLYDVALRYAYYFIAVCVVCACRLSIRHLSLSMLIIIAISSSSFILR